MEESAWRRGKEEMYLIISNYNLKIEKSHFLPYLQNEKIILS